MAKRGEKMLNFDVPEELWDRFDNFFKRQAGVDKQILGRWAIYHFMQEFDIKMAGDFRDRFENYMQNPDPINEPASKTNFQTGSETETKVRA